MINRHTKFRVFLLGLGAGISLAWVLEAFIVGRGAVSTYLAPVGLIALMLATFLRSPKE